MDLKILLCAIIGGILGVKFYQWGWMGGWQRSKWYLKLLNKIDMDL